MLNGCYRNKISHMKIVTHHSSIIMNDVDSQNFHYISNLCEKLDFQKQSMPCCKQECVRIDIAKGKVMDSYYVYEDGYIKYHKSNQKIFLETRNLEVAKIMIAMTNNMNEKRIDE